MPVLRWWLLLGLMVGLAACASPQPEVVKIGLVAPFEGRYREVGYDVIPAARLAVREYAQQYPDSPVLIELVAYDDLGDPTRAELQAQRLASDSRVAAVLGHWLETTSTAANPVYTAADLTVYSVSTDVPSNIRPQTDIPIDVSRSLGENAFEGEIGGIEWGLAQHWLLIEQEVQFLSPYYLPEQAPVYSRVSNDIDAFVADFQQGSGGAAPGIYSALAYDLTWLAIADIVRQYGIDVAQPLQSMEQIDVHFLYQWQDGQRVYIEMLQ